VLLRQWDCNWLRTPDRELLVVISFLTAISLMFLHLFHEYFCMWLNCQSASLCIDTILKYYRYTAVFCGVINRRQLLQKSNRANHLQCSHRFSAIYVNDIICKCSASGRGYHLLVLMLGVLMYADDLLLISSTCSDWHRMTKISEGEMK